MRWMPYVFTLGTLFAVAGGPLWSAEPSPSPAPLPHKPNCVTPGQPAAPCPQPEPGKPAPEPVPGVPRDVFAQAPEAGLQAPETYNPNMFGDQIGAIGPQLVRVPGRFRTVFISTPSPGFQVRRPVTEVIRVPLASAGAFKIAENESPRPVDRVFVNYNYFNNVLGSLQGPGIPRIDLHRETLGFEKTFLDGNASLGMRLPLLQFANFSELDGFFLGDLSFILKYALINNRENGNILSGGLVVTAPTGEDELLLDGLDVHSTLIQPWGGFIYNMNNCYLHGFSSLVIPTDSEDVTFWANDLGVGWWAYRNRSYDSFITAVVPTVELHVNTPLNHRGAESVPIGFIDSVNVTGGINMIFRNRCYLGLGVATPLTGPQPFDVEALANLNIRF